MMDNITRWNRKGDFPYFLKGLDLTKSYKFIFNTSGGKKPYEVLWEGSDTDRCKRVGNDLKIIFQDHHFDKGRLYIEMFDRIADSDFAAGYYHRVSYSATSVELTSDISDNGVVYEDMLVVYQQGDAGLSAYQLAVQQGYVGTVEQWLASLKATTDELPKHVEIEGNVRLLSNASTHDEILSMLGCATVQDYLDLTDSIRQAATMAFVYLLDDSTERRVIAITDFKAYDDDTLIMKFRRNNKIYEVSVYLDNAVLSAENIVDNVVTDESLESRITEIPISDNNYTNADKAIVTQVYQLSMEDLINIYQATDNTQFESNILKAFGVSTTEELFAACKTINSGKYILSAKTLNNVSELSYQLSANQYINHYLTGNYDADGNMSYFQMIMNVTFYGVDIFIIFTVAKDGTTYTVQLNTLTKNEVATQKWVEDKKYLTQHQDLSGKADTVAIVYPTNTTYTIHPNKDYQFGEVSSLIITLATPTNTDIANIYSFSFGTGDVAPTIYINKVNNVDWSYLGGTPVWKANRLYEVNIKGNKIVVGEF